MQPERDIQCGPPVEIDAAIDALFQRQEIDEDARTIEEIMARSGLSRAQTDRRMKDAVAAGTWEQVLKRGPSGRTVKAYRPKK